MMHAAALVLSLVSLTQENPEKYSEFTFSVRVAIPGGEATDNSDWSDFLSPSYGLGVHYSYLPRVAESTYIGPYGGFFWDNYGGKSDTVQIQPIGPADVEPDALFTFGLEFGGKIRHNIDKFFLEGNIGIGVLFYSETNADITAPGVNTSAEAIASSSEFMFTVGGRAGVALSPQTELAFGVAFQLNGAPDVGDDFTGFSFENQENVVLTLYLNINF